MKCSYQNYSCKAKAEGWLVAPDGKDCPGTPLCRKHADRIISEYADKLDERWSLRPLTAGELL